MEVKIKNMVLSPRMLVEIVKRFSVEAVPADLMPTHHALVKIRVQSEEFTDVFGEWSPVLDITRSNVDDAIDELKCGLDLLIDAVPVDVHGEEIHRRAKNHLGQALELLTKHLESGGKNKCGSGS